MYSPVRMCQPTTASVSRPCQPAAPELMNNQIRMARKNRSDKDGIRRRAQRRVRTASIWGTDGRIPANVCGGVRVEFTTLVIRLGGACTLARVPRLRRNGGLSWQYLTGPRVRPDPAACDPGWPAQSGLLLRFSRRCASD